MYEECFGSKILGETIEWVPNCICGACCIMFTRWLQNKDKSKLLFSVPVRWSKPQSKKDCYFCQTNVEGIRQSSRRTIVYPNVKSVLKPQYTGSVFENRNDSTESFDTEYEKGNEQEVDENDSEGKEDEEEEVEDSDDEYINGKKKDNTVMQKYTQAELNDLVRNLGLSKEGAEFLASDLKRKNLLTKETRVTVYRNREKNF